MKLAIISICSESYKVLSDVTYPAWRDYAARHGYDFISEGATDARGINWQKISMIEDHIKLYDLVLWVGADTIVTNPENKIEQFWMSHGTPSMIMSADVCGINSDVMLFAKGAASEMFLYAVNNLGYDFYKDHHWGEQEAIIRFAHQKPYSDWVKIIPQKGFNSYIHAEYGRSSEWPGNWEKGDWILHLPGISLERRIEVLNGLNYQCSYD